MDRATHASTQQGVGAGNSIGKKLRIGALALGLGGMAWGQTPPAVDWETTFGTPRSDGNPSLQRTSDEGYILAGYTTSSNGDRDVYLVKTFANGVMGWEATIGVSDKDEAAKSVQQTRDGDYYIVVGRRAEVVKKYCEKGNPLFVEGRLTFDSWEAQDGTKRSKLRVTVENFEFIGGGGGGGARSDGGQAGQSYGGGAPAPAQPPVSDDDIPF